MKTNNIALILEEAKLLVEVKQFNSLLYEDIKTYDKSISDEEFDLLFEALVEDGELLVEFLGTIAGLGSKAAKWLGSKSTKLGNKLGKASANIQAKSKAKKDQKELGKAIKSTRGEHTKAVKSYGKALKSGDSAAQKSAMSALKVARNNSRIARGESQFTGKAASNKKHAEGVAKLQGYLKSKGHSKTYHRLGEAIANIVMKDLLIEKSSKNG